MIFVPAGPMLRGNWRGQTLGRGTDAWKYWDELRAGNISEQDWLGIEDGIARSLRPLHDHGHGLDDDRDRRGAGPDAARRLVIPAPDANHIRMAAESGRRIVGWSGRT